MENAPNSASEYVSAWRRSGRKIAKLFGGLCYSYDPGYSIKTPDGKSVEISTVVARTLITLIEECEKLQRENAKLRKKVEKQK